MDNIPYEINYISRCHGLSRKDILNKCRRKNVVAARNDAIFFIRINYGMSLEGIGYIFNMHHSSVAHAITRHLYADPA